MFADTPLDPAEDDGQNRHPPDAKPCITVNETRTVLPFLTRSSETRLSDQDQIFPFPQEAVPACRGESAFLRDAEALRRQPSRERDPSPEKR